MSELTIVDLGLGNLHSVARGVERAGALPRVTSDPDVVARASRLLVPGQGAFRDGAAAIAGELGEAIRAHLRADKPYLGICLGMQLLFERSDEAPGAQGFGWFAGEVRRLVPTAERKVPHMGWNTVTSTHPLLEDPLLDRQAWFYFVHGFHCVPEDSALTVATVDYGAPLCAAVGAGALFACQFHPEKSGPRGQRLLERFIAEAS